MEIFEQNKRDLPNATTVLVLGILSLVFGWCYGIIGLVLGIIAVALSGAPRKAYLAEPELYTESSYKNINAGRVCGIIAICLSVFVMLFFILVICGIVASGIGAAAYGL